MQWYELCTLAENGGLEISERILLSLGKNLKSTCMGGVWLVITKTDDKRFPGDVLPSAGTTYFIPAEKLAAMQLKPGVTVEINFSEELQTIIVQKLVSEP